MENTIEQLLIQKILEGFVKQCSIILMTKSDFKKLVSGINSVYQNCSYKEIKKGEKRYMGLKIYITKDLKKG